MMKHKVMKGNDDFLSTLEGWGEGKERCNNVNQCVTQEKQKLKMSCVSNCWKMRDWNLSFIFFLKNYRFYKLISCKVLQLKMEILEVGWSIYSLFPVYRTPEEFEFGEEGD